MASKKKRPAKKPAKKAVKKVIKKPAKKSVKKTVKKKAVKKVVKKASVKKVVAKKVLPTKLQPIKNVDYAKAITPLADRLVVRVSDGAEKITAGGIIIPSSVSQATGYLKATVLAVGHGAKNKKGAVRPLDVKKGDTVLFSEHAGTKIQFNSEDLQIIHESDVMGIIQ